MAKGADQRDAARERLSANPFYVLGLRPDCARAEVEREGQKLIAMLELELSTADDYRSPLGVHRRTPELVREAMAELRDPNRRLLHELWATLNAAPVGSASSERGPTEDEADPRQGAQRAPFAALAALGFGDRRRRRGS